MDHVALQQVDKKGGTSFFNTMLENRSPETDDILAVSRAKKLLEIHKNETMEVEIQESVIKCVRANHHIVKLSFDHDFSDSNEDIKKIKSWIYDRMRSNCLNIQVNKGEKCLLVNFEDERSATLFASSNFDEIQLNCGAKMLTNNYELDEKKVKIWRPATGYIDVMDLKASMGRYGQVEEFYEQRNGDNRKGSFIVAFANIEVKNRILEEKRIFIGKQLMKIDNYVKNLNKNNTTAKVSLMLRISNIPAGTTEFWAKGMMKNMNADFWHIPIAKNGLKMRCLIASF